MNINLVDLQNKKVKGSEGVLISDNKIDLSKFTGSELILTGKYTKGLLLILRPQIQVTFKDAVIDNAGTNETIELGGTYDQVKLWGDGSTKLFGKVGNSASQLIFFKGIWSNIEVGGFEMDQRRDNKTKSTVTGACLQFEGVLKAGHNLGNVHVHDMIMYNTGDEGDYINHFGLDGGYVTGENLLVENVSVFGSGRDLNQQWGFRNVIYRNCYGENGGKEADSNHCSALSLNGYTETLLVENCEFKNVAQLIYSGSPAPGKSIKAVISNVKYTQGTHAGERNNSSLYLKGPGEYLLKGNVIDAPNVKEAAITADGCKVIVEGDNQITAPRLARIFNSGTVAQTPAIKRYPVQAEVFESTINGSTTRKLLFEGREFIL